MVEDPATGDKYLGVIEESSSEKKIEVMEEPTTGEKHVEVKEDSTAGEKHVEVMEDMFTKPHKSSPPLDNTKPSSMTRLKKHLAVEVSTSNGDIVLLVCCVISGLVDSTIYNAFGTFVSMQTVSSFIPTFHASCLFYSLLDSGHDLLQAFLGQHNLPGPWWLHTPHNPQALWLGQILHLHHILLSRLLRLQFLVPPSHAPSPFDNNGLFPRPNIHHLRGGRHNPRRSCEWKLGYHCR